MVGGIITTDLMDLRGCEVTTDLMDLRGNNILMIPAIRGNKTPMEVLENQIF